MNRLEQIQKIHSEVFYNTGMASQKTIDLIEDIIRDLDRDTEENPIQRVELGAINSEIDVLLEVWNPDLKYDIDVLIRLDKIIEDWAKAVEFVNIALGIPREQG
jgi:hypothetical protein